MTDQLELTFRKPVASTEEVDRFVELLRTAPDWLNANDLLALLGLNRSEGNRRLVRLWAESSQGQVISGQKGYRHITKATAEEITQAAGWLEHQAKCMESRAPDIRRQAHKLIR